MDRLPPPPPYTETDLYSASSRGAPTNSAPTEADDASVAPSSADGSVILTPPYTPDGSCRVNCAELPAELPSTSNALLDSASSTSASASTYFESRSINLIDDILLVHTLTLRPNAQPRNLIFPQPEIAWLQRGITKQDWATFVNYLIPHHIDSHNSHVADRKLQAELLGEGLEQLTMKEDDSCRRDLSDVDAQLEPLRRPTSDRITRAEDVVAAWNENFFAPRCVHIDLEIVEELNIESSPEDLTRDIPGAWAQDENAPAEAKSGPSRRRVGGGLGGFIRAGNDGFHVGRNLISADNNGFRMGKSAVVADSNGFRMGNLLVADSNGFRLGNIVADSNGFRIGTLMKFGSGQRTAATPSGESVRGERHRENVHPPGQYQNDEKDKDSDTYTGHERGRSIDQVHAMGKEKRSSSISSSSSSSSSESEASVGSLPDYDNLSTAQLPVAKRSIQQWLEHPDLPITAESVKQARQQIKEANRITSEKGLSTEEELKALRNDVKALMIKFKSIKRMQRAERRSRHRERRAKRRAEKKERREARKVANHERKQEYRGRKEARRAEKGKDKEQPTALEYLDPMPFDPIASNSISQPLPSRPAPTNSISSPLVAPTNSPIFPQPPQGPLSPRARIASARARAEATRVQALAHAETVRSQALAHAETVRTQARARHEATIMNHKRPLTSRQTAHLNRNQRSPPPRTPALRRGLSTAMPPRPLQPGSEASRLWGEAQRIRRDIWQVQEDVQKTTEQAEEFRSRSGRAAGLNGEAVVGGSSAEDEKMALKLRDIADGLAQEARDMELEAARLEAEALRLAEKKEEIGEQESGVIHEAA